MPFRLAVFTSHVHGSLLLRTLCEMEGLARVVLVATDDPRLPYSNARLRLWRYWFDSQELDRLGRLVPDTAKEFGLTAFTGRVRHPDGVFARMFEEAAPDAIVTSVYGQRLPGWMLDAVGGRAGNVHNVIPGQPLVFTRGPQPIEKAIQLGVPSIQMVLHRMSEAYDDGPEIARSEPYPLPRIGALDANHMMMIQEGTAPLGARLIKTHLPDLLAMKPARTSA